MGNLSTLSTPLRQFSDAAVPHEPTRLRQGDSWTWERIFPDFPSALYRLKYVLNSPHNRFVLDGTLAQNSPITAADDGQAFVVQATRAATAECQPDTYQLSAVLIGIPNTTADGEQVTLPLQDVTVDADIAGATGPVDTRSIAKKNLDAIEACLLGTTDPSVAEYTINGRMLRRFNRSELLKEREYWRNEYNGELRAAGLYASNRNITFRFRG
jgi:hypothetical protein